MADFKFGKYASPSRSIDNSRDYHSFTDFDQSESSLLKPNSLNTPDECCCIFKCFDKLPLLHPFGPLRTIWDIIILIMLVYSCIEIPYTLGMFLTQKYTFPSDRF